MSVDIGLQKLIGYFCTGEFLACLLEGANIMPSNMLLQKSALANPLWYGIGMEVNTDIFIAPLQSIATTSPSELRLTLTWDLGMVQPPLP